MKEPGKMKIRLNLFDAILLVVVLLAGGLVIWFGLRQSEGSGAATTNEVVYTIKFQQMAQGTSQLIQPGDQLEDTVKNFKLGTVTAVEIQPAVIQILDQEERKYVEAPLAGYEDVYVTLKAACVDNGESLLLDGGYDIRVGQTAYVRGPGYMGSGPVTVIGKEGRP